MLVTAHPGRHLFIEGDSSRALVEPVFDLVMTSPPYFHPTKRNVKFGHSPKTKDLGCYSEYVARVLMRCAEGLKDGGLVCIVKTDAWYNGHLIPIGYSIVDRCISKGLRLHAHWIWEKRQYYSPYSPSFANIFLMTRYNVRRLPHSGLIKDMRWRGQQGAPNSFAPELFERLIELLTAPGAAVLDPFAGAGTAIEAAAKTGRWGVGIEISKKQLAMARKQLSNRNVSFQITQKTSLPICTHPKSQKRSAISTDEN
jgi:DNA modification methylase